MGDTLRSCDSGAAVVGAIFKEAMEEESGPHLGADQFWDVNGQQNLGPGRIRCIKN